MHVMMRVTRAVQEKRERCKKEESDRDETCVVAVPEGDGVHEFKKLVAAGTRAMRRPRDSPCAGAR